MTRSIPSLGCCLYHDVWLHSSVEGQDANIPVVHIGLAAKGQINTAKGRCYSDHDSRFETTVLGFELLFVFLKPVESGPYQDGYSSQRKAYR